jgi:hypothetical protein
MLPKFKKTVVAAIVGISLFAVSSTAMAASTSSPTLDESLFSNGYQNKMSDGSTPHYFLDVTSEQQQNQSVGQQVKNFFDPLNVSGIVTGGAIQQQTVGTLYEMGNWVANLAFRFNVFMTTALLNGLQLAFNHSLLDKLIDSGMQDVMRKIAGVDSSGNFTNSGLIGSLMPFITAVSVLFALYLFLGTRAQMAAFKSILSTILVLSLAAGFFINYAPFLKGMNALSTDLSQVILVGPSQVISGSNQSMNAVQDQLFSELWDQFVYKPYLDMQYGTDDVNSVGQSRIDTLLKMPPDDKRLDYITKQEVEGHGNKNMTYSNVNTRLIFTGFYFFFNTFNGVPFFLLMLGLVVTQYWFLAIGCLAPFAFAWAAFPNQIGVLKRYGQQLALPLIIKILLTLGTLMYLMITKIVFSLNGGGVAGYIDSGFSMLAILVGFFLLRKQIIKIFGGSKEFNLFLNEVRELRNSATKMAGTVAGAVVGGATGAVVEHMIEESSDERGSAAATEDVKQTKESYNPSEKVPTADLFPEELVPGPPIINWSEYQQQNAELPEQEEKSDDSNDNLTEDSADDKMKLDELPEYEADEEESDSEREVVE